MRRRQPLSPHNGDTLPQTMQQAQFMTARKRRKRNSNRYPWSRFLWAFGGSTVKWNRRNSRVLVVAAILCLGGLAWTQSLSRRTAGGSRKTKTSRGSHSFDLSSRVSPLHHFQRAKGSFDLVLPFIGKSENMMFYPSLREEERTYENYGGLELRFLETDDSTRVIYHDYGLDEGEVLTGTGDDDVEYYYAFDDDLKRNPYVGWEDDEIQDVKHCRRTSWHRDLYLNCNSFHEFGLLDTFLKGESKYLG